MEPVIPPDPPVDCLRGLENFPGINRSAMSVKKFACMVEKTLKPWLGIPGAAKGVGSNGMIHPETLRKMSEMPQVRILHACLVMWYVLSSDDPIQLSLDINSSFSLHMMRRLRNGLTA